jgi:POT family proton-dependent oligopeptide transporter
LFILPTGLGLFARLAPPHLGATTVASWFLVIFSGSLTAGLVGTFWSSFEPSGYFMLLAAIAGVAAILLRGISKVADPVSQG